MALKQPAKKSAPPKALKAVAPAVKAAKTPATIEVVYLGPARQLMLDGRKYLKGKPTSVPGAIGVELLRTRKSEFGTPDSKIKSYTLETAPEEVVDGQFPAGGFKTREAAIEFGIDRFGKGFWHKSFAKQVQRSKQPGAQPFDPACLALSLLNGALREALQRAGDDTPDADNGDPEAIDTATARIQRRAAGGKARKLETKPGATVTSGRAAARFQQEIAV